MAKKVSKLLELSECCTALNMTEEEVLYLVRTRAIPHRVEEDGRPTFTGWEILARVIPKPPKEAMGKPRIDVTGMTKDEIMEVFGAILQMKASEEAQALKKEPPKRVELTPEEIKDRPTKKDMEIPEPEEKEEEVPTEETETEIPVMNEEVEPPAEKEKEPKKEIKPKKDPAAKPKK